MPFSPSVTESVLVKAARCCCLCRKFAGVKIEVHHAVQEADGGSNEENNAVSLCFDCHCDVGHYNPRHPKGKKFKPSEVLKHRDAWFALVASGKAGPNNPWPSEDPDVKLIRFYRGCFNRPVFQDTYVREGSYADFDKAIEDTITALNTGTLKDRSGTVVDKGKGTSKLINPNWMQRMEAITLMLRSIRQRYAVAEREQNHHQPDVSGWMDHTRHEVIHLFNDLCDEAGVPPLPNI